MANFAGLNIDSNVEEQTGAFTVLPAGKYLACLVGDELKDNKAKTGKVLKLKLQIIEGQFAGTIIDDHLNITNPNATAQAIGQGTLKRICNLCKVQFPPQDTNGLMGKPMVVELKVEKFTSNNTGKELQSNKVAGYHPADTKLGQAATAQQPAQGEQPVQNASGW